jgi:hypothetical protein
MEENEARETRTYTIPCKRTKETFVLVVDGIIKFGFVAMLLPVASALLGPSAPAGRMVMSVRISRRGQQGVRLGR